VNNLYQILHIVTTILSKWYKLLIIIVLSSVVFVLIFILINRLFINPPVDSLLPHNQRRTVSEQYIQLNVLNGTNNKGIARQAMNYLRDRGFDVVEINNYESFVKKSFILDLVNDSLSAHNVAFAVGIGDSMILKRIDSSLYLRVSLIIGQDYLQLKPFR
jgi:LytR cell envelope-related transcriptional attenuator